VTVGYRYGGITGWIPRRHQPLPAQAATKWLHDKLASILFQSTLPTRAATVGHRQGFRAAPVSIHAAHAGSDAIQDLIQADARLFQSTLPTRAATRCRQSGGAGHRFQSTLPTRAATPASDTCHRGSSVSIHAAHAGSDRGCSKLRRTIRMFQSTLPTRAATCSAVPIGTARSVSIHAAHAGSDLIRL